MGLLEQENKDLENIKYIETGTVWAEYNLKFNTNISKNTYKFFLGRTTPKDLSILVFLGYNDDLENWEKAEKEKALSYWKNLDWENVKVYDSRYWLALWYAISERLPYSKFFPRNEGKKRNIKTYLSTLLLFYRGRGTKPSSTLKKVYKNRFFTKEIYEQIEPFLCSDFDGYVDFKPLNYYETKQEGSYFETHSFWEAFCTRRTIQNRREMLFIKKTLSKLNYHFGFYGNIIKRGHCTYRYIHDVDTIVNEQYQTVGAVWPLYTVVPPHPITNQWGYTRYESQYSSTQTYPSQLPLVKDILTNYVNEINYDAIINSFNEYMGRDHEWPAKIPTWSVESATLPNSNIIPKFTIIGTNAASAAQYNNYLLYIKANNGYTEGFSFRKTPLTYTTTDYEHTTEEAIAHFSSRETSRRGGSTINMINTCHIFNSLSFRAKIRGKIRFFGDLSIYENTKNEINRIVEIPTTQIGNQIIFLYNEIPELSKYNVMSKNIFLDIFNATTGNSSNYSEIVTYADDTKQVYKSVKISLSIHHVVTDFTQGDYPFEFV